MISRVLLTVLFSSAFSAGCVSKGTYNEEVKAANSVHAQLDKCNLQVAQLEASRTSLQKQLDDATAVDEQLSKELAKLGEDSKALLATNGSLKSALDGSRSRLEELRRAQAAAEKRAALYKDVALRLKGMVDTGDLSITLREGRMVLRLSNDVLFDSGKAELKPAGKRALAEIASVLSTVPRRFQVAGHTDNEPIRLSPYKSNWELSAERALEVIGFLISRGMQSGALSAAGYGEFDPADTNDTREGKSHNRRTEITLQPNIDEIVSIPEAM